MDQKQFNRVIAIGDRIVGLQRALREITDPNYSTILGCLYKSKDNRSSTYSPRYGIGGISDILERHDKAIREEIREEIESLAKEIEEL